MDSPLQTGYVMTS